MSSFGERLILRLEKAAARNQTVLDNNQAATRKLDIAIPILEKDKKGNQIALAAMREVYNLLESDAEERQSTITELKDARDLLVRSVAMLEQAGFDFSNIQTFSNDEIWLGDHLPTIERVVEIVNLQKLEVALDKAELERFEDFAHAVKRSGEKRQAAAETDALGEPHARQGVLGASEEVAAAALAAIDAIKVATDLIADQPSGLALPAEGTEEE